MMISTDYHKMYNDTIAWNQVLKKNDNFNDRFKTSE